ncbi:uncharacterized protein LOC101863627 [Aplysia californica]|uniref:Uncharacterized protein LOC101863627 n=1 Tax=Aplysia californica TaxID=6500 RepID=A0ABM1W2I0_APLCA|nr:uncharacterized protein LOC101863627 [Aplysia californica]
METGQDDTPSPVPDSPPPPRDHETGMPGGMPSSYPVHRMSVTLTSDDQVQMGLTVYDRRGYMVVKDDESYVTLSGDDQDSTTYPEETFSSTFSGEDPGLHEPEYLHQHLQQQRQQETQSTDRGGHVYSRPVHYGSDKHVFNEAGEFVAPTVHILISKSGNWTATGGLADSAGVVSPSELDQQLDHEERQHQANNSFPEARVSLTITSQQQQQLAVAKADRRTVMKLTGTEAQGGDSKGQD